MENRIWILSTQNSQARWHMAAGSVKDTETVGSLAKFQVLAKDLVSKVKWRRSREMPNTNLSSPHTHKHIYHTAK